MIGPRVGVKTGIRTGVAPGVSADPIAPTTTGTTTTTCTVDLADSADPVITGGDAFAYTAVVRNTGSTNSAQSLSLAITLDSSLTYVSSSGTGWSISVSGQVVTATLSALGAGGTANTVTVNVTTGGSAITASTSAALTGSNFAEADDTETTTVQLVTKDATAGKYFPASTTEWTNFIARKGLSMSVPDSIYLMQEASGNLADSGTAAITLTAAGSISYQQTATGYSRKGWTIAVSGTNGFRAASGVGPSPATTSSLWLLVASVTASAAGSRSIIAGGGAATSTEMTAYVVNTAPPNQRIKCATVTTDGSVDPTTQGFIPYTLQYDRANSVAAMTTPSARITATYNSGVTDGQKGFGAGISSCAGMTAIYGLRWDGAHAEVTDANIKALEQALGWTITR
jgi:hypothetical protein